MRAIDADILKAGFEEDGHLSPYIEEYIDACPTVAIDCNSGCNSGCNWISVKYRFPDIDEVVLICTDEGLYDVAQYSGGDRFWTLERNPLVWVTASGVTHWMHLPEAPKEE